MSATAGEREAAGERLRDLAFEEMLRVFRALSELDFYGVDLVMRDTSAGPIVTISVRDGLNGHQLATLIDLAGQNLDVSLEGPAIVYSCPSWPTRQFGDGR